MLTEKAFSAFGWLKAYCLRLWADPARRRFAKRALLAVPVAFLIGWPMAKVWSHGNRIGVDLADPRCLPWRVYYMKFGMPAAIDRGDFIAFVPRDGMLWGKFQDQIVGKKVMGLPGDVVTVKDNFAWVNGEPVGELVLMEKLELKPGALDRVEVVPEGKLFVVGTEPRSFDSRYWGFLDRDKVVGSVHPVF